jgi:hypothetical protein
MVRLQHVCGSNCRTVQHVMYTANCTQGQWCDNELTTRSRNHKPSWQNSFLDFKLSPCCECCILSFGWFRGFWILWNSVPKRRHLKFRRRGITQKKECNKTLFTGGSWLSNIAASCADFFYFILMRRYIKICWICASGWCRNMLWGEAHCLMRRHTITACDFCKTLLVFELLLQTSAFHCP